MSWKAHFVLYRKTQGVLADTHRLYVSSVHNKHDNCPVHSVAKNQMQKEVHVCPTGETERNGQHDRPWDVKTQEDKCNSGHTGLSCQDFAAAVDGGTWKKGI